MMINKTNSFPQVNTHSVLQILFDLSEHSDNYLDINHSSFIYVSKNSTFKDTEPVDGFKPIFRDNHSNLMVSLGNLKFDEDRPNVSILVQRNGSVTLPENDFEFGNNFKTYIWRHYKIVKDGVVNFKNLPVILCEKTYHHFFDLGIIKESYEPSKTFVINIEDVPVINEKLDYTFNLNNLFNITFNLYKLKVKQKIVKSKLENKTNFTKFNDLYTEEAVNFLKTYGVTENGFAPKLIKKDGDDDLPNHILEVRLAGLLAIPTIESVEKAILSGKSLTPAQSVMRDELTGLKDCSNFIEEFDKTKKSIKILTKAIAFIKFSAILKDYTINDVKPIDGSINDIDFSIGKIIKCSINFKIKKEV